jgi:hypothetical protein|tara:strand:+ start:210 stop:593 length:384 start_codon:yes stop_codon:yes gene_type:complete
MLSALRVEDAATSVTVDVRTYASPRARVARLDVLDDQHDHHPSHRHPRGGVVLRLGRWDEAEEAEEEKENVDPSRGTTKRRGSRGACTPSRPPLVDITRAHTPPVRTFVRARDRSTSCFKLKNGARR